MNLPNEAINVNSVTDFTKHIRSLSIPVKEWSEEDQNGTVRYARVNAYGSTTHTLVERNNYPGDKFLPNWGCNPLRDSLSGSIWSRLPPTGLQKIDHLALNQISGTMKQIVQWCSTHRCPHLFFLSSNYFAVLLQVHGNAKVQALLVKGRHCGQLRALWFAVNLHGQRRQWAHQADY